MDAADPGDPSSDSLVTLVYNIQDEAYYDCAVDTYTAGYFAPGLHRQHGHERHLLDSFDWANRVGSDPSSAPWSDGDAANDRPELYEGVIAHELEHLLMNYSDPGELSWVDEGLADVAAFLNGYDMTGSHLTYQQVFHRETSLTRWGGGLENYGASFSYFDTCGSGPAATAARRPHARPRLRRPGRRPADQEDLRGAGQRHDRRAARDRLVQRGDRRHLPTAKALFEDWAVTMYLDDEASNRWDLKNFDLGPASGGWTIDVANSEFWDDRGFYQGSQPDPKFTSPAKRPPSTRCRSGSPTRPSATPARGCGWTSTATRSHRWRRTPDPDPLVGRVPRASPTTSSASAPPSPGADARLLELAPHRGRLGLRLRRGPGRR